MRVLLLIILIGIQESSLGQTISTFCGNGVAANTGDGGLATTSSINYPIGGVFDRLGNYYFVTATGGNSVREIYPSGIISTICGGHSIGFSGDGGAATAAQLNNPQAVNVDESGNLYIADNWNHRIRKINITTGIISTVVGTGIRGFSGDGGAATDAKLNSPTDICFDRHGNMYIADCWNWRIRKVTPSGIISTYAGCDDSVSYRGDGGPATNASITLVHGIAIDQNNNLLLAGSRRVRMVDTNGIISTIAGCDTASITSWGDGRIATCASIGADKIACSPDGKIYFCAFSGHRVCVIDRGILNTVVGTGIAGSTGDGGRADSAEINYPSGLIVDQCKNLYISEGHGFRIRKVTFPGTTNATIHISASPSDTICPGMPVLFDAAITLGGATPGYRWYVNGIARDSGSSRFTYIPTAGDSVWCVFTSSSPCAVPPVVSSNVVHMVPRNLGITIAAPPWGIVGTNVAVTATITGSDTGSCTYKWYNRGVYATTTAIPRYTYIKAAGIDTITATLIYNHADCTDSASSNRITVRDSVLGIATFTMPAEVEIYPNPAHNTLGVTSNNSIEQLEVLNVVGQQLKNTAPRTKQTEITIGDLPKGMYLLRINGCLVRRWLKE